LHWRRRWSLKPVSALVVPGLPPLSESESIKFMHSTGTATAKADGLPETGAFTSRLEALLVLVPAPAPAPEENTAALAGADADADAGPVPLIACIDGAEAQCGA
jgi:hypothetical protein